MDLIAFNIMVMNSFPVMVDRYQRDEYAESGSAGRHSQQRQLGRNPITDQLR